MLNWVTCMCLFENSAGFARLLVQQLNERTRNLLATIDATACTMQRFGSATIWREPPMEGKGLITNRRGNNRILDLEKLVRFKE